MNGDNKDDITPENQSGDDQQFTQSNPLNDEKFIESQVDAMAEAIGVEPEQEDSTDGDPDKTSQGVHAEGDASADSGDQVQSADPNIEGGEAKADPQETEDWLKVPEGLSERATQRFQTLHDKYNERNKQAAELEEQFNALVEHTQAMQREVQATGATPEKFNAGLAYMSIVNNPDSSPQQLRQAKTMVESELRAINERLGEVNDESQIQQMLSRHPDLAQAVENLEITPGYAAQIAAARLREAQSQQRFAQQQQSQAYQQQQMGEIGQARDAVNNWVAQKVQTDPNAQAIIEAIKPTMAAMAQHVPTAQWIQMLEQQYQAFRGAAAGQAPPPNPREQPLSGDSMSAGEREPKDSAEALLRMFGHA